LRITRVSRLDLLSESERRVLGLLGPVCTCFARSVLLHSYPVAMSKSYDVQCYDVQSATTQRSFKHIQFHHHVNASDPKGELLHYPVMINPQILLQFLNFKSLLERLSSRLEGNLISSHRERDHDKYIRCAIPTTRSMIITMALSLRFPG